MYNGHDDSTGENSVLDQGVYLCTCRRQLSLNVTLYSQAC